MEIRKGLHFLQVEKTLIVVFFFRFFQNPITVFIRDII